MYVRLLGLITYYSHFKYNRASFDMKANDPSNVNSFYICTGNIVYNRTHFNI